MSCTGNRKLRLKENRFCSFVPRLEVIDLMAVSCDLVIIISIGLLPIQGQSEKCSKSVDTETTGAPLTVTG